MTVHDDDQISLGRDPAPLLSVEERRTVARFDAYDGDPYAPDPVKGPWCPICRQPVPQTGMAWVFPPHGEGCPGTGRKVRDLDHGYRRDDGVAVPYWESTAVPLPPGAPPYTARGGYGSW